MVSKKIGGRGPGAVQMLVALAVFVMPWMPLERLQENVTADMRELLANRELFRTVAFEALNFGPNSTVVVDAGLTDPVAPLAAAGIAPVAMLSTYHDEPPHRRPEDLQWAREIFADPQPFFEACFALAARRGYAGFNVDMELTSATARDAADFAVFVDAFAAAAHQQSPPLSVTADVASWSPLFNLSALGRTRLDGVVSMDTYVADRAQWDAALKRNLASVPADKLVVGLMTLGAGGPLDGAEGAYRFEQAARAGVQGVAIWPCADVAKCTPVVPDSWLPAVRKYVSLEGSSDVSKVGSP